MTASRKVSRAQIEIQEHNTGHEADVDEEYVMSPKRPSAKSHKKRGLARAKDEAVRERKKRKRESRKQGVSAIQQPKDKAKRKATTTQKSAPTRPTSDEIPPLDLGQALHSRSNSPGPAPVDSGSQKPNKQQNTQESDEDYIEKDAQGVNTLALSPTRADREKDEIIKQMFHITEFSPDDPVANPDPDPGPDPDPDAEAEADNEAEVEVEAGIGIGTAAGTVTKAKVKVNAGAGSQGAGNTKGGESPALYS